MLISFLIVPGLTRDVQNKIAKREYGLEDLKAIYNQTLKNIATTKTVIITDAIIFLLIFGFISYQIISADALVFGIIFGLCCYLVSMLVIVLSAKSVKKQFPKLLQKYYPEYYEQIINGQNNVVNDVPNENQINNNQL